MEKFTIEEKARRYDEAITKGKQIQNSPYTAHWDTMKEVVEHLFPELKESEDERIRKALIDFVEQYGDNYYGQIAKASAIAWLEKKGNNNTIPTEEMNKSIGRRIAISLINYLDDNRYEGAMDMSSAECEDLENSILDSDWGKVYRYMQKKLEKQGEHKCNCKYVGCHVNDAKRWCHKKQSEILYEKCNTECPEYLKQGEQKHDDNCLLSWSEIDEKMFQSLEGIVKDYWAKAEQEKNEIKIREASNVSYFLKTIQKSPLCWIKCSDGLPNRDGTYLVVTDGRHNDVYDMARYDSIEGWHKASEIIYWMPIPQLNNKSIIEQKPVGNVEPKFKVGDWIINNDKRIAVPTQILKMENYGYLTSMGYTSFDKVRTDYHLWTIQDAKDGDVLAVDDDTIVMFKDLYNDETFHSYCHIEDSIFSINDECFPDWWEGEGFYPATKEQRDILFQKMKESGYEWDADKKELKKIEHKTDNNVEPTAQSYITPNQKFFQWIYDRLIYVHNEDPNIDYMLSLKERIEDMQKPVEWSEKDKQMLEETLYFINEYQKSNRCTDENGMQNSVSCENWLESLKPQPKQEWTDEDKENLGLIIEVIKTFTKGDSYKKQIDWLKSLKPQSYWKPTEEQLQMLHKFTIRHAVVTKDDAEIMESLYNDLNNL